MKSSDSSNKTMINCHTARLTAFTIAVLIPMIVQADTVLRRSTNTPVQGEVTQMSKTEVVVKPRAGGDVTVPVNDIVNIRWTSEPPKLNITRNTEQVGRLSNALQDYTEISKDGEVTGNANLKADVQFFIARTTAKMALADSTKVADAIKLLEDFRKNNPDHYRYYESLNWLGQVHIAAEDPAKARPMFELMGQAPWTDYQMAAKNALARILLLQDDVAGAIAAYDAVIGTSVSEPAEISRKHEAMLGKAMGLIRQEQYDPAVAVLEEVIEQVSPTDTATQAEAYVRLGDCLQALGRSKEALLAYLHIDVLFSAEKGLHAEALYQLTRMWAAVGKPDRAADARATLESLYPDSKWTARLGSAAG